MDIFHRKLVAKAILAVAVIHDGLVQVETGDTPSILSLTDSGEGAAIPVAGDYVIVGDNDPPRWMAKADYEAQAAKVAAANRAEADRIAVLTPEEQHAEIMSRYDLNRP